MKITKDHLPWNENGKGLRDIWICPECGALNAWDSNYADRFEARTGDKNVFVCSGSCFDNICGNCGSNIVKPDSPILSPCYTHEGDLLRTSMVTTSPPL